jgi:hypothetical protein
VRKECNRGYTHTVARLPRAVYILQAGLLVNAFGNGAANPFLLVYLHNVRGIPLGLAGLVAAPTRARHS